MSTKELWLGRNKYGLTALFRDEPTRDMDYDKGLSWRGKMLDLSYLRRRDMKALGLPTIRKGTKKKIKLTVKIL